MHTSNGHRLLIAAAAIPGTSTGHRTGEEFRFDETGVNGIADISDAISGIDRHVFKDGTEDESLAVAENGRGPQVV